MADVSEALEQIRTALINQNLIPVTGAGVSMGAAKLPSWPVLLERGVEFLRNHQEELHTSNEKIAAIDAAAKANFLTAGLGQLQKVLDGPDGDYYQAFLYEQFAEPPVEQRDVLDALAALRCRVMVTTNYDLLLEQWRVVKPAETVTWLQADRILSILRGRTGIIHLHGRFDQPESVILSDADYERIVNAKQAEAVADALFHSGVLLFVGCSLDSVHDKHLMGILTRFASLQGPMLEGSTPHYMLIRGKPKPAEWARLKKLGIVPISYGDDFGLLAGFLRSLRPPAVTSVRVDDIHPRLRTIRVATSVEEILTDARQFLDEVVFPGRKVRVGFAEKVEDGGRTSLINRHLIPPASTHNSFAYPQTMAAWALIEGRILAFPADWDRSCDFNLLEKLNKLERVKAALLNTDATDSVLARFLNAATIREKTSTAHLTMRELYQHWVGRQPEPHYSQFISVPVPLVDTAANRGEPPEYGVLNIDTKEEAPLLTAETRPLLKLLSEVVALGIEHLQRTVAAK